MHARGYEIYARSQLTLRDPVSFPIGDYYYLNRSASHVLLGFIDSVKVIDLQTQEAHQLQLRDVYEKLICESEEQKRCLELGRVSTAFFSSKGNIIVVTDKGVASVWDSKMYACIQAKEIFTTPVTQTDIALARPFLRNAHQIGSLIICYGRKAALQKGIFTNRVCVYSVALEGLKSILLFPGN